MIIIRIYIVIAFWGFLNLKSYAQETSDLSKVDSLINLAFTNVENENVVESFSILSDLFKNINSSKEPHLYVEANLALANIYYNLGQFSKGFQTVSQLRDYISLPQVSLDQKFRFNELLLRGTNPKVDSLGTISKKVFNNIESIIDATPTSSKRQEYLFKLGRLYFTKFDYKSADSLFSLLYNQNSLNGSKKIDLLISYSINKLQFKGPSVLTEVLQYLEEAKSIAIELNDDVQLINVVGNIASVWQFSGNLDNALKQFNEILPRIENEGLRIHQANTYLRIATIYTWKEDLNASIAWAKKSLSIAEKYSFDRVQLKSLDLLYNANYIIRNDEEALKYLIALRNVEKRLDENKVQKEIASIQSYLEIENRKRSIILLEQARDRDRVILGLFSLIILIITITTLFIWFGNKRIKKLNQSLKEQKKHLEEVVEKKNLLFSIIGHDLRGPIGNIYLFFSAIMDEDDLNDEEKKNIKETLLMSAESSLELLENLLYWGRDELNDIEPQFEVVHIDSLLDSLISLVEFQAGLKEIKIHFDKKNHSLNTDEKMISLILRNITTNAIKFTPKGGAVSITTTQTDNDVTFKISDTGIGIKKTDINKLLHGEGFTLDGTSGEKGSGVGMYLVKSFTHMLNGTVDIESKENKGTRFILTFPKQKSVAK